MNDQLMLRGMTLQQLVAFAFNVPADRISGGSGPERYDVTASLALGTPREISGPMLVKLLSERLSLKLSRVSIESDVYEIGVAPGGIKVTSEVTGAAPQPGTPISFRFGPNDSPPSIRDMPPGFSTIMTLPRGGSTTILAGRQTIAALAKALEAPLGSPVIDKTGLTAVYSFDLAFSTEAGDAPLPVVMQEKLGLTLTKARAAVDYFVVGSANKEPQSN